MKIYSGCGNTFVIAKYDYLKDNPDYAKRICNNKTDGLILVKQFPLEMIMYNKDGSSASMCGNGIRCFIKFCYDEKIINSLENSVKTPSGYRYTKIVSIDPFMVYVGMNEATYSYIDNRTYLNEPITVNNHTYNISLVNTGVWHGVIITNDLDEALIDAPYIQNMEEFKDYLNVDIVIIKSDSIYVKTYERGVGFTQACGTGAMATFHILKKLNLIDKDEITITVDGGIIKTGIDEDGSYILGESKYLKEYLYGV